MATRKPNPSGAFMEHLRDFAETYDRENPVIGERFIVEEVCYVGNEYDYETERRVSRSHTFETEEAAQEFMTYHDPDRYHKFEFRREVLRHMHPRPYKQWHSA